MLRKNGWVISDYPDTSGSIVVVDTDRHPSETRQFRVTTMPTFVRVVDGQQGNHTTGFVNQWRIASLFFNKTITPQQPDYRNLP